MSWTTRCGLLVRLLVKGDNADRERQDEKRACVLDRGGDK